MKTIPVTAVILTRDEEANLPACLASLRGLVDEIFVVDSGSTDATCDLARAAGAQVVTHEFTGHSAQWRWAMENLPIRNEWVLGVDADQWLTDELITEMRQLFGDPNALNSYSGFYIARKNIFRGKWIRWGGYYPKYFIKLFRKSKLEHEAADLLDHHFHVSGAVGTLRAPLVEENQKENEIDFWIMKHLRYAELLAIEDTRRRGGTGPTRVRAALFGNPDERAEWQKKTWALLPRFIRPPAYFIWRYIVLLGFLDGKQGFVFHFLHAFWYRLITDLKIDELHERDARTRN